MSEYTTPPNTPAPYTALVPVPQSTAVALSKNELAKSRLFPDINSPERAAVVMAQARALDLDAVFVASNTIFISGKPGMSGLMLGVLVKRKRDLYRYRVKQKDAKVCKLEFLERVDGEWELQGTETFSYDMAVRAKLTSNPSWTKYPEQMNFWRCLVAGVRTYAPDVLTSAPGHLMEELDPKAEYDAEGRLVSRGVIIDAEVCEPSLPPAELLADVRKMMEEAGVTEANALAYCDVTVLDKAEPDALDRLRQFCSLKLRSK